MSDICIAEESAAYKASTPSAGQERALRCLVARGLFSPVCGTNSGVCSGGDRLGCPCGVTCLPPCLTGFERLRRACEGMGKRTNQILITFFSLGLHLHVEIRIQQQELGAPEPAQASQGVGDSPALIRPTRGIAAALARRQGRLLTGSPA